MPRKPKPVVVVRFREIKSFLEFTGFTKEWERLKLTVIDHAELQRTLSLRPKAGRVIRGATSLRKLRFAPEGWDGKRGGLRIIYGYVEAATTIVLMDCYPKNEQEDLTYAQLAVLETVIERIEARVMLALERRSARRKP